MLLIIYEASEQRKVLTGFSDVQHTVKKGNDFPLPSKDVKLPPTGNN